MKQAITEFLKIYDWVRIPGEADGHCGMVSSAFCEYLKDEVGLTKPWPRVMGYRACTSRHHPLKPKILTRKQFDQITQANRTNGQWTGHAVVAIGRIRIDFTARQFDPKAPVPLVWTVKSPRARGV